MIETEETLIGSINIDTGYSLIGHISPDVILKDVIVIRHWLEETMLYIRLNNEQTLTLDLTQYVDDLTDIKLDAIRDMKLYIQDGELIFEYDENIVGVDFSIELNDLIVDDNDLNVDFNINENKELEVMY